MCHHERSGQTAVVKMWPTALLRSLEMVSVLRHTSQNASKSFYDISRTDLTAA